MKKLLFLVSNDLNHDQRMIRICSSLQSNGYDCTLIGRELPSSKPLNPQPFAQRRFRLFFNKGKLFYIELNIRLFFMLLRAGFDGVCAVDLDTILPAFWVCGWKKKPLIYDAHEYFTEVPELLERPKVKKLWEWVADHTIPRLRYAYTVCQSLADLFQQRYKTHFGLIRNVPFSLPLPENRQAPAPQQDFILLYQGVLNEGRGLEQLFAAMPSLDGCQLWVAGEGDISQKLRDWVQTNQMGDKIRFLGYLNPQELKQITQQAHLGVNLLVNKSLNYYYSLANKCFDYIQACKPALNMDFPEYRHINQRAKTSLLLADLEANTIINAVLSLKNDPILYQELSDNCLQGRQWYNWEQEERQLLDFYHKIFLV